MPKPEFYLFVSYFIKAFKRKKELTIPVLHRLRKKYLETKKKYKKYLCINNSKNINKANKKNN